MKEKTIELGKVRQGERFKLDGVEFVKLDCDEEATFVLTADTLPECCAFEDDDAEREDHNNFDRSLIQKIMERFWREQHSPIFKAIVERPIDLTSMDGMTTYGKPFTFRRQEQRRQSHEFSCQAAHPPPDDAFDALRARLLLHDLFLLADEEQALLIRHRLHGCSLAETARREGMSIKRVRHRLKALYRAYFAQEKTKQKEL